MSSRFVSIGVLALLASPSVLPAQTTYRYVDFEPLLPSARVVGINNAGHVVLNAGGHAYLYRDGEVSQIPEIGGLSSLSVSAFNDYDQLLGTGLASDGTRQTFVYDLPTASLRIRDFALNVGYEYPLTINNLGQVPIGSTTGTWNINRVYDGDTLIPITGHGLNNQGDLLLDDYSVLNLRTGVTAPGAYPELTGIVFGDNGWMAGSSPSSLTRVHYRPGQPPTSEPAGSWRYRLYASDISGSGAIVGSLWDETSTPWHGFVSLGGALFDLNDLATPPDHYDIAWVTAINDAGQMVGYSGQGRADYSRPFLLEPTAILPVPEPSTYGLGAFLFAGALLLWRRHARPRPERRAGAARRQSAVLSVRL